MSYKLNNDTLEILKNFAKINPQASFRKGAAQRTWNDGHNFIADVELSDPLPKTCAIFELNRLLGIIDTCKGAELPTINFGETSLVIEHDHGEVTIPYAADEVVAKPTEKNYRMIRQIASFDLPLGLWKKICNTASILETPNINLSITKKGGLILKLTHEKDKGGDSSGSGSASYNMPNTEVQEPVDATWTILFNELTLLPGDYTVTVGDVASNTSGDKTIFGVFFTLNDPNKRVTYLTSGNLLKSRAN